MIPGKGHISRPRNDQKFFNMRMEWMLAQTYGTPFNYIVRVHGGAITKVAGGKRAFDGNSMGYGFYEPGTVLNITAPATKDGKRFSRWASTQGTLARASSRSTSYTTAAGDVVVTAIYGRQKHKLTVVGGAARPASPLPGQVVTVTAGADTNAKRFFYWTTRTGAIDIAVPSARSFRFIMPSEDVTLTAQHTGPPRRK